MRATAQRITLFVVAVLFVAFLTGCNSTPTAETGPPTLEPITPAPTSTTAPPTEDMDPTTEPTTGPQATQVSSGPATCEVSPLQIPEVEGIPPIGEDDHQHGTAGAPITLIEYADFQ